eukprot:m.42564 g.42564  ORF g.42564 m.42564 type:complete len:254 (-) comp10524_c0_seq1:469-1230(-)
MTDTQQDPSSVPPPADDVVVEDENIQQEPTNDGFPQGQHDVQQQPPYGQQHHGGFRRNSHLMKKTRLCRGFEQTGECQYGDACWFAHGQGDLREPQPFTPNFQQQRRHHPFAKTKMCKFMSNGGTCPYKEQCNFAHSPMELRQAPPPMHQNFMPQMDFMRRRPIDRSRFKTRLCKSFSNTGFCKFQEMCAFAHGQADLRQPPFQPDMYNPGFQQPFYGDMNNGYAPQQPQFNMYQPPPQSQQMPQMGMNQMMQ